MIGSPRMASRKRIFCAGPSFALDVVCRQSLARKSGKVRLLVVQRFASESKNFFRSEIPEDCLADAIDIGRQPGTAAIVVHDDFEKIGVLAELGVVLCRAIERAKGIVMPDVPADHGLPAN